MRTTILVAMFVVCSGFAVSTQPTRGITMRIELPNGDTRQIRAREGNAVVQVQLADGDEFRDFYLQLAILDLARGLVLVSVRNSKAADAQTLDEFELVMRGALVRARTAPSFALALLEIDER